jgi:hypothetical protein
LAPFPEQTSTSYDRCTASSAEAMDIGVTGFETTGAAIPT